MKCRNSCLCGSLPLSYEILSKICPMSSGRLTGMEIACELRRASTDITSCITLTTICSGKRQVGSTCRQEQQNIVTREVGVYPRRSLVEEVWMFYIGVKGCSQESKGLKVCTSKIPRNFFFSSNLFQILTKVEGRGSSAAPQSQKDPVLLQLGSSSAVRFSMPLLATSAES